MNNKKLIRLTEQDLHWIVRESVETALNEIGDTQKGQYMLGRLRARYVDDGIGIGSDVENVAYKGYKSKTPVLEQDRMNDAYRNGFKTQRNAMNGYYDNPQQVFQQNYNNYRQ